MAVENPGQVKKEIRRISQRKKKAAIALCIQYAGIALNYFRSVQRGNRFWNNQTRVAMQTVFSGPIVASGFVGWFLAHAVEYGVYLELANNRKNQALLPVVTRFYGRFIRDLQAIYED